jgi:hypothetical protein
LLVISVGALRVAIVHGDACSVAGWRFSRTQLDDPELASWLEMIHRESGVDVFASTHTCDAVMRDFGFAGGRLVIANNGAAGMGNFAGDQRGLITRVSTRACPHAALYGTRNGATFVDALPVAFDVPGFMRQFDELWPVGSPGEVSYRKRILGGSPGGVQFSVPRKCNMSTR